MAKYKRKKIERPPSHPGEILKNIWLDELGITQSSFAQMLAEAAPRETKVSTIKTKLSEVINGKRGMSAEFAVLIAKVLKTSPRLWMNLQVNYDLWHAENDMAA